MKGESGDNGRFDTYEVKVRGTESRAVITVL